MNQFLIISLIENSFFKNFKILFYLSSLNNNFFKDLLSLCSLKNSFFKDFKGQLSLEFLLISFLAILILVSITLPIANLGIDYGFDSSSSLEIKSELSKIANGIDSVYSNGAGSKRTLAIEVPKDVTVRFSKNPNSNEGLATVSHVLSDGSMKKIELSYKYPNLNFDLHLIKGYNSVIVEWPLNSTEIIIYKHI
ncbi:MAG: hypothetical protein FWH29_07140 [Methanobrevibacter sp.]|nr:hypothetical protein [Methanobrevibacter sp.]